MVFKLGTTWTSWAKRVGIKKGGRAWYSKSAGASSIIDDAQRYKQFVQYMRTKRRPSVEITIGSDNDWNSS